MWAKQAEASGPVLDVLIGKLSQTYMPEGTLPVEQIRTVLSSYFSQRITFEQGAMVITQLIGSSEILVELREILNATPGPATPSGRTWTAIEDRRLLKGIHIYGLGMWKEISQFVGGGRTRSQCAQRWHRSLNPTIRKDQWTSTEQEALILGVQRFGDHAWAKVAALVKTRTDVQCRYRWYQIAKTRQDLPPPGESKPTKTGPKKARLGTQSEEKSATSKESEVKGISLDDVLGMEEFDCFNIDSLELIDGSQTDSDSYS